MKKVFLQMILLAMCTLGTLFVAPTIASAATVRETQIISNDNDVDWLRDNPTNDVFKEVTDKVQDTGKSAYRLLSVVAGAIFVICTIVAGMLIMLTKNQNNRSEAKTWLINILVGMSVIALVFTLYGVIMGMTTSLGGAASNNSNNNTNATQSTGAPSAIIQMYEI